MGMPVQPGVLRALLVLLMAVSAIPARADSRTSWQASPFEFDDTHLPVLEVTLHSRKKPDEARTFRFMLDTGAARCVLDTSVPEAFFWNDLKPVTQVHDGAGQGANVPAVLIKRILVGGMLRDLLPAVRIDLKNSLLGRFQDQPIDGILGMPFLRGTRFLFNPIDKRIEWWNVAVTGVGAPIEYLPDGRPSIRIRIGQSEVPCTLDTGAAMGFQLPVALKPEGKGVAGQTGGVLSGAGAEVSALRVPRIEVAGRAWREVDADFLVGGETLMGEDIWSAAAVGFDFIENVVVFAPRADGSLPIQPSRQLPIAWDRSVTPARLVVLAIRPNTALERAGLKPGDQIIGADGVEGTALQRRTLIDALGKPGAHIWSIRRGDRELRLEIR